MLRQREEVRRAERAPAEIVEAEARDAVDRLRDVDRPPEQRQLARRSARLAGQARERRVHRRIGVRIVGTIIDRRARQFLQAIIHARAELEDHHPLAPASPRNGRNSARLRPSL